MKTNTKKPTSKLWTRLAALYVAWMITIIPVYVQNLEVVGKVKVTQMDSVGTGDKVVVRDGAGTLAERDLNKAIIAYFLTLTNGIEILLEAGESVANLLAAGAEVSDLLASGVSVGDLLAAGVSVNDLVTAGAKVSALLANGITPLDIFNAGVVIDSFYGKTYEGGLIFYLNTSNGTGLVSATADQSTGIDWDDSFSPDLTGATGVAIGTGQANTNAIVAELGGGSYAASICDNLVLNSKSDWFLPSKDELNEMYSKLKVKGFGGFSSSFYWSSTEASASTAWRQDFSDGDQNALPKGDINKRVRAARAF